MVREVRIPKRNFIVDVLRVKNVNKRTVDTFPLKGLRYMRIELEIQKRSTTCNLVGIAILIILSSPTPWLKNAGAWKAGYRYQAMDIVFCDGSIKINEIIRSHPGY